MKAEEVWQLVAQVPQGRVTTYGAIAKALGNPAAARPVGQILKRNPFPEKVPCHRVVRSDGSLGGYQGNRPDKIRRKVLLLRSEGVKVVIKKGDWKVKTLADFFFADFW